MAKKVVLLGDATLDLYLLRDLPISREGEAMDWQQHRQWRIWSRTGGPFLVAQFMKDRGLDVLTFAPEVTDQETRLASMAELDFVEKKDSAFRRIKGPLDDTTRLLRVSAFEGYNNLPVGALNVPMAHGLELPKSNTPPHYNRDEIDICVISDAGSSLRFAKEFVVGHLGGLPSSGRFPPIIIKMHRPLADGFVWDQVKAKTKHARHVIVSADDLRASGVMISNRLSWDATARDVEAALNENELLAGLVLENGSLIILFDVEGAAVVTRGGDAGRVDLVFHSQKTEGAVDRANYGDLVGKMSVFLAEFSAELAAKPGGDLTDAVSAALALQSDYAADAMTLVQQGEKTAQSEQLALNYPTLEGKHPKSDSYLKLRGYKSTKGSLLGQHIGTCDSAFVELAKRITRDGLRAISSVPYARFGSFATLDAEEIEGYRAIQTLFESYLASGLESRPLSIAVFGPPGSGKSFGVRELAKANGIPDPLEFNISECEAEALPGFFHDIRDVVLSGKTPMCFFDEFDSRNEALLAHFLAPMQDGRFRDGTGIHPIGKAIFVFAGGVSESFEMFSKTEIRAAMGNDRDFNWGDILKARKVPDFASRLRGHINIKGVNKNSQPTESDKNDPEDRAYVLRRSLILRSLLEKWMPGIFERVGQKEKGSAAIDDAVLDLLLVTARYHHGARSMEQIVKMSIQNGGQTQFSGSHLPYASQLGMHLAWA